MFECYGQGFGVQTQADGIKYEGEWANGKQHGKGKYISLDGTVKIGIWKNGICIKWIEDGEGGAEDGAAQ